LVASSTLGSAHKGPSNKRMIIHFILFEYRQRTGL
jgi:hypothetical protein